MRTSLGPTPEFIKTCGDPMAPPAKITSLFTLTCFLAPFVPSSVLVHSTAVAFSPADVFVLAKIILVTVALGRMSRFARGGNGSMYAERAYERVQLAGFIAEVAMNAPAPNPPFASGEGGIPIQSSVAVQRPTISRRKPG